MNSVPMRDGYGKALLSLCEKDPKVIVLDADVANSTRTVWIRDTYPEQFMDMGIAEQDMVGTAAGLALGGMTPFISTYCVFLAGRAWDQIRTTVCYNNLNVKFGGAHAGISVGPDGATHQALEDVALTRVLPNMHVIVPCDAEETRKATLAAADIPGPCFVRFGREAVPVITDEDTPFTFGKIRMVKDGTDVAIIANGSLVYHAMEAAKVLEAEGIDAAVIDCHTVKPLDEEGIEAIARKTGCIVTAEEHQIYGGLGGAVAECLARRYPVPMEMVAVADTFGESGKAEELMEKYGLDAKAITEKARIAVSRKN